MHPSPVVDSGDTTHVQMQKQLWSHADVPEVIKTHPQLQALCPSHVWMLLRAQNKASEPSPKVGLVEARVETRERVRVTSGPQKGIWSPQGITGLVPPFLSPAHPQHPLSLLEPLLPSAWLIGLHPRERAGP